MIIIMPIIMARALWLQDCIDSPGSEDLSNGEGKDSPADDGWQDD